jgi:hypothetical protein
MTDERLRELEHAFRVSGDLADLGRWLARARASGAQIDLAPLELASACGAARVGAVLGDEGPSEVSSVRALCRALERSQAGARACGSLALEFSGDLEPANPDQVCALAVLTHELREWSKSPSKSREGQARCLGRLLAGSADQEPGAAAFERAYRRAVCVLSPNRRASAWALHDFLGLVASAPGGEGDVVLSRAQEHLATWAIVRVLSSLEQSAGKG